MGIINRILRKWCGCATRGASRLGSRRGRLRLGNLDGRHSCSLECLERLLRIFPRNLLSQILDLLEMAVAQFLAAPAWARPVPLHLLRRQIVEICCYHPKVGCLEQLPIELENPFRAVRPLAKWPGLPLLYHGLRKEETVEWPGEEFQQRAAVRPETPALVRKQHAGCSIRSID